MRLLLLLLTTCFAISTAVAAPIAAAELTLRFLDVGQGDGFLITTPEGKTVLVDAGPPDHADAVVNRLKQLTSRPLDLVVLTHAHTDHMGGMAKVLMALGARTFLDAGFNHPSAPYEHLLKTLHGLKIPVKTATLGRTIDLGSGATLVLLAPAKPFFIGTRSDANANCIVARLSYGKTAFYLSGDSEFQTEQQILRSGATIRSDLYKVAHHGSRHASTEALLARMQPSVAVISVGAGNGYGHPSAKAIQRLQAVGAKVYRTDLQGEITVRSDGVRLVVTTAHEAVAAPILAPSHATPQQPRPPFAPTARDSSAVPAQGYLASRRSAVFHRPDCAGAADIKISNRQHFHGREAALAAGKQPAKDCLP
ncbi:MAG: MBL fold metallo-hydrolase [Myxococcales bacterium]|nr:MBL fold metallo-hydrolase [Myxococcales bacterium]